MRFYPTLKNYHYIYDLSFLLDLYPALQDDFMPYMLDLNHVQLQVKWVEREKTSGLWKHTRGLSYPSKQFTFGKHIGTVLWKSPSVYTRPWRRVIAWPWHEIYKIFLQCYGQLNNDSNPNDLRNDSLLCPQL